MRSARAADVVNRDDRFRLDGQRGSGGGDDARTLVCGEIKTGKGKKGEESEHGRRSRRNSGEHEWSARRTAVTSFTEKRGEAVIFLGSVSTRPTWLFT